MPHQGLTRKERKKLATFKTLVFGKGVRNPTELAEFVRTRMHIKDAERVAGLIPLVFDPSPATARRPS